MVALVLTAYWPALQGGFIWDDDDYVTENQTLRSPAGLYQIWFDLGATPQYYPLVFTTFWLEYRLWGLAPLGYHLVNVLLHAGCAIGLWRVLRKLGLATAWYGGVVFAIHPVHVESVAWVTELKNVLSGCLSMLALLCYLRFRQLAEQAPSERRRRLGWWLAAVLVFWLALLSKSVTASLPAAILLILWWKQGRLETRDWLPTLPLFGLALLSSRITVLVEQHVVGASQVLSASWMERLLIAGRAFWFYIGKLLWPSNLCFFYPKWKVDASEIGPYLFPALVVLAVAVLYLARGRLGRGPVTAFLYFGGTLLPALGFFDVYPFRYSYVADHFQYLASIGIIVLVVESAGRLALRGRQQGEREHRGLNAFPPACLIAAGCVVGVLAGLTWRQGRIYQDHETLWRDTVAKNPQAYAAHANLAGVLWKRGEREAAIGHLRRSLEIEEGAEAHFTLAGFLEAQGNKEEARRHFRRALDLNPSLAQAGFRLGALYREANDLRRAVGFLRLAAACEPDNETYIAAYALTLSQSGATAEARRVLNEFLRLHPASPQAYRELGAIELAERRWDAAIRCLESSLSVCQDDADAHFMLGACLAQVGRTGDAQRHFAEAHRLRPDWQAAAEASRELADNAGKPVGAVKRP